MATPKLTKSYAEVEAAYFAKVDKLDKEKLAFITKHKEAERKFMAKHEQKKLKIETEFEVACAECSDMPTDRFMGEVYSNPGLIGNY